MTPRPTGNRGPRRIDTGGGPVRNSVGMSIRVQNESQITALLIAPNRDLAQQFTATMSETHAFQILADLKSYPPPQTLEIRARQLKPDVVLLDLASDLAAATELIRFIVGLNPPV